MTGLQITVTNSPNIAVYPPGATFGPRVMADWEFVWLLEGDAVFRYQLGRAVHQLDVPQGHLLLCHPDRLHSFEWDKTRRTRHGFFHFQLLESDGRWPAPADWPLLRRLGDEDLFVPLTRHLVGSTDFGSPDFGSPDFAMDAARKSQLDLAATLFLAAFLTGATQISDMAMSNIPEAVERALRFIAERLEANAAAPLGLEELARASYVSPEHLCRLFKKSTGHTPLETVRLARLDRAALLLARSNYNVAQVASLCGFASQFHFSRSFKVEYGQSPRALRAALENGAAMPTSRLARVLRGGVSH